MTRPFLLTALLLSLSTSVTAQEPMFPWGDPEQAEPAPVTFADVVAASDGLQWDVPLGRKASALEVSFQEDVTSGSPAPVTAGLSPDIDGCIDCGHSCFRPVNTGGCRIPFLDPWCDCCETTCCTTDEWSCHPCQSSHGNCYRTADGGWVANDGICDVQGKQIQPLTDAVRFGWWGVSQNGSLTKVGEFQDLKSSPFFDVDTIRSDGNRTLDLTMSGLDNEANSARARFYSPGMKADVRFNRFLRRLDHDPPAGFESTPPGAPAFPNPGPANDVVTTDLNVGQDYAIRVEQLDARFQGRLTDNIKWKLNVWGMRKFGERQTNTTAHCFNFNAPGAANPSETVCHVVSQRQSIDWLTMEMQPAIEARFEKVTLEYSRTMRTFGQADQSVARQYTRFNFNLPAPSGSLGPDFNSAITPENFTQIDRLKASAQLTETDQLYANVYHGDTHNENRDTHRQFSGWDLRLINTSREDLTVTAYTSMYDENNELPTTFLNASPLSPANGYDQASVRHPVDYQRTRAGINGRWKPYDNSSRWQNLSWMGGYEYYMIARDYATYDSQRLGVFTQPDTNTHQFELGPTMRWSSAFNTYARYKVRFTEVPLIGVRESTGRFNTNQPNQDHRVDLGGTWTPTDYFMATAQFSVMNAWQYTQFARFSESSYPVNFTLWYAPTDRLSFTTGYAYFTNWIDQDIAIGFRSTPFESTQWSYGGENHLVSLSANYALSPTVHLVGGYEWNHGNNSFIVPASTAVPPADWSQLSSFSDVVVKTQRVTAGLDWQAAANMDVYLRYNFFDYNDVSANYDSGTANMALAGVSFVR